MKLLFFSSIFILICSFSPNKSSVNYKNVSGVNLFEKKSILRPVTIKVDFVTTFMLGNLKCTDHVTGTITLEYNGFTFTGIISSSLHHSVKCGNKPNVVNELRSITYDEASGSFTDIEFYSTGDVDLDAHLASDAFKIEFLPYLTSQLEL